jgi:hypothetical protein
VNLPWTVVATFSDVASAHAMVALFRTEGVPAEVVSDTSLLGEALDLLRSSNFPIYFFLFGVTILVLKTWRNYIRLRADDGAVRPIAPANAIFSESGASGYSEKSLMTRLGGASRCLLVWASRSELSIQSTFPFSVITYDYNNDLRHRIPLRNISSVERRADSTVRVAFADTEGVTHSLVLRLKRPDGLIAALKSNV